MISGIARGWRRAAALERAAAEAAEPTDGGGGGAAAPSIRRRGRAGVTASDRPAVGGRSAPADERLAG
jgi:hypothetical protein